MSSLNDLNNHLFAQLERLSAKDITPEELEREVSRAGAIVSVADQITENTKMRLAAAKLYAEHGATVLPHLPMIGGATK